MAPSYGALSPVSTKYDNTNSTRSTVDGKEKRQSPLWLKSFLLLSFFGAGFLMVSLLPMEDIASTKITTNLHHRSSLQNKASSLTPSETTPNIVLVTLDDVGMNDVGWQSDDMPGASPRMTAMAYSGIILAKYYGQASCSPARATILSGRYVHRTGFQDLEVSPFSNYSLPADMVLLPEMLSRAGYVTYGIGKWNIGHCNDAYLPWKRGFSKFLGFTSAGIGYFMHDHGTYTYSGQSNMLYDMLDGEESGTYVVRPDLKGTYDTIIFRDRSNAIITGHSTNQNTQELSFFLWLAFHGVHSDDGLAEESELTAQNVEYLAHLKKTGMPYGRLTYARAMMIVDAAVGSTKDTLEILGILNNTIMVVHSDNGAEPCVSEIAGNNMPYRSCKFQYFEGGIRVPAFVYAPGFLTPNLTGTIYNGLMHHVDLYATFAHLSGYDDDDITNVVDGVNQWHAITGTREDSPRVEIMLDISDVATIDGTRQRVDFEQAAISYIYAGMKLIKFSPTDVWYEPNITYPSTCIGRHCKMSMWLGDQPSCNWSHFLFNLTADPFEKTNLYFDSNFSDLIMHMMQRVQAYYVKEHFQDVTWGAEENCLATRAFAQNGDYVVPWGCPIQRISSSR